MRGWASMGGEKGGGGSFSFSFLLLFSLYDVDLWGEFLYNLGVDGWSAGMTESIHILSGTYGDLIGVIFV